ncbi:hypothetical protein C8F01DRAFT_1374331 [Mycena amicta]|nr:hypothetical protein C8F01DRAFT_1374331 [Mycena amicta]
MKFCADSNAFDLADACVRGSWAAVVPTLLVLTLVATHFPLPLPHCIRRPLDVLKAQFTQFLPLHEAEGLALTDKEPFAEAEVEVEARVPLWTFLFSLIGLFECLAWLTGGSFLLITGHSLWEAAQRFLVAATWIYTVVRRISRPTATPPYDMLALYVVHLAGGILQLGGYIFQHSVYGASLPSTWTLVALSLNLGALFVLLAVVFQMPLALPSHLVKKEDIGHGVSPEDYCTLGDWVTFSWIYPLLKRGRSSTLNEIDVSNLSPSFSSRPLFIKFSAIPQKKLLQRLWAANSFDISMAFLLTWLSVVFNYAGPFFLKQILDIIEAEEDKGMAYIFALLMFVCSVAKSQCDVQHIWLGRRAGTRIRSELMAAIYDKALKRIDLSGVVNKEKADGKQAKSGADIGTITNLFSGDASRISNQVLNLFFLYGAPMEIVVGSLMLYQLLGFSAFSGFIVLFLVSPLNSSFTRRNERVQKAMLKARDARMGVLTELIGAIKPVKFFAWEQRWIDRVFAARSVELGWLVQARINGIGFLGLWTITPILMSVVSFCTFVMLGNELTTAKAFTAVALFKMIREPLNVIPSFAVQISQTQLSINRIAVYLDEPEVPEQFSTLKKGRSNPIPSEDDDHRLGFQNASFKWNEGEESSRGERKGTSVNESEIEDHKFELKDISVIFPEGRLTLVTGPTASGKTALLMAALGEMTALPGGRIIMTKNPSKIDEWGNMYTCSYAAQSPWLRHQSIKDNILFGYPFDEVRYNEVLDCCALRPDLDLLEDDDETEIGEKGVSLSGGQKARVALARAVYAKTKYVLLDDPLSAVDSHTSRILYEKCLRGPLLANRTVVLVTHHVQLVLPGTYYLVRMSDGRIDTQGTVSELRVAKKLDDIAHDAAIEVQKEAAVAEEGSDEVEAAAAAVLGTSVPQKTPRKLVEEEYRAVGGVKLRVYRTYLDAMSYWIWAFLVLSVVFLQLLGVGEKYWMKIWGEAYHDSEAVSTLLDTSRSSDGDLLMNLQFEASFIPKQPSAAKHPLFYVMIYAGIGFMTALITVISSAAQMTGAYRAGQTLFKALVVTIVRAPFRFHDTTPQGRMLNRFGKDIETIDLSIATSLQRVNGFLAAFLAAIITVTVVFPMFIFPAVIIGYFYYTLAVSYLNTGRDLRRMESNSRSPIFSDFAELLHGIVTVRAFGAERRFLDNLHVRIDMTTKMWYTFWMTNQWLQLNFDFLGSLVSFFLRRGTFSHRSRLYSLLHCFRSTTLVNDAGLAGLALTSALNLTTSVYWTCYWWTQLELDLNSVERVVEYLELPQEPPGIIESSRPPAYWPSSAANDALIVAENVSIKRGERVGLLGRTGSGKSTLAMSILRFTDPSSGQILIDGIDITKIGVEDLRSRLTFIPQDATLFSGTLRENLDPFNEHDDATCLDVLYRVQMISRSSHASQATPTVASPEPSRPASRAEIEREASESVLSGARTDVDTKTVVTLDTQVSAGGTNFSQGQRQLIAMARALLRRSAIVILDEATSSVDYKARLGTDAKIQTTIREEFTDSLLLTIAHRLKTVIDYDRLLLLDKGKVVEFDTPYKLIQKKDGIFRGMCLKTGYFDELESAARAKAERDGVP